MKLKINHIVAAGLLLLLSVNSFAKGIEFENLSLKEGLEKAKAENKLVFIDVYATWCGPCKYLSSNVFVDNDLGDYMNEHFVNLKLDGEKTDGESLMIDFELDAYPTMLFLSPDKELLKKVVGVVSAEDLLGKGQAVVDPESTEIFKMTQEYNNGKRDREFLGNYLSLMIDEELETEAIVEEFLELYPDLDLSDEEEFYIFCLGTEGLDNELTKKFLDEFEMYAELYPGAAGTKINWLLVDLAEEARQAGDPEIIKEGVKLLYGPFLMTTGSDFTEESLEEALLEIMEAEE